MGQTVRFQETLRRPTMIGEGFGEGRAGLGLGLAAASALDPKTAALLRVGMSVALGSPAVCLEWSAGRAEGGYTAVFELICRDCGDDPGLDDCEISPGLQRVRGAYPIADGIRAYEQHLRLHQQLGVTTGRGRWPVLADRR